MSSPNGMALVRKAFSSGPLSGRAVGPLGRQHHGEVAQADGGVRAGQQRVGVDQLQRPDQPLQVPLGVAAEGGDARVDDAIVRGAARAGSEKLGDELPGGLVGFLGGAAGPRVAVHGVLGDQAGSGGTAAGDTSRTCPVRSSVTELRIGFRPPARAGS